MRFKLCITLLLAVFGLATPAFAAPRKITQPIRLNYSVDDPQFMRSLEGLLGTSTVEGNSIETLINGDEVFPAMLEAIRGAEKSITLENFIWSSGELSTQFVQALSERSLHGVKVQVLTDHIGSLQFKRRDRKALLKSGAELIRYNQPAWWINPFRLSKRTHRKLLVVDGTVGFIGGICISDKWTGNAEGPPLWRDNHYRVKGPIVAQLQGIIADNWLEQSGRMLEGDLYFPEIKPVGPVRMHAFKSGPTDGVENSRLVHLYAIAAARKSIRLAHSYFLPDPMLVEALLEAHKRGVKIEIMAPGRIGVNVVQRASRPRWHQLMEVGVEFHVYQRAYFHCKVMVVDDAWVTTGSVNIDRRSFRINDEANVNVYDRAFAAQQIEVFDKDKADSTRYTREDYLSRPWYIKGFENFCSLFRGVL